MKINLITKQQAKAACLTMVSKKIAICQKQLNQIQQDLSSETKSSAGDKYETGRAMLQLEREKIGKQLAELEQLLRILNSISIENQHHKIQLGSLVQTSQQHFFISVSLGEIKGEDFSFFAVSKETPIALALIGKSLGQEVKFRDQNFYIEKVV